MIRREHGLCQSPGRGRPSTSSATEALALGHLHLETTMRYLRFLLPPDALSPLDRWEKVWAAPEALA